jgi:UDP-N-acetylmuramoylalanine--D-glutamate ligase
MAGIESPFLTELKQSKIAVVGLGLSGMSVLKYLLSHDILPKVFDSRLVPPVGEQEQQYINQVERQFGQFKIDEFVEYDYVFISPGISLKEPAIAHAMKYNDNIFCDVELFARLNNKPVLAVTGSNGKSTVVAWLEDFLRRIGYNAVACGNYGVPVMDVLDGDYDNNPVDVYVMELSSFQLESTHSLICEVATVLNVTPDHMDRYDSFSEYSHSKLRIYQHAKQCLYNNDDFETKPLLNNNDVHAFGTGPQSRAESYWHFDQDSSNLMLNGEVMGNLNDLALSGAHNGSNAIVVLAMANALGVDPVTNFHHLSHFKGLPHRCQLVANFDGVRFIDDSKATNLASTQAALNGLTQEKNIVLIAGGDAKGADLSPLKTDIYHKVKQVIALGKDKVLFTELVPPENLVLVDSMDDAVKHACKISEQGDIVLLSPACASIDMYKNYQQRGEHFKSLVLKRVGS